MEGWGSPVKRWTAASSCRAMEYLHLMYWMIGSDSFYTRAHAVDEGNFMTKSTYHQGSSPSTGPQNRADAGLMSEIPCEAEQAGGSGGVSCVSIASETEFLGTRCASCSSARD